MMNKRLIWNFEINIDTLLQLPNANKVSQSPYRWESRFFWPEDTIVILHGLDIHFLELSRYKIKHKDDVYYLLKDADYNLKVRHEQLFYKPMLEKRTHAIAYGKKIPLNELTSDAQIPGIPGQNAHTFIKQIESTGTIITVAKEAVVYKFATTPSCKLELARLLIDNKCYFSVSIESDAYLLVESICNQLINTGQNCDYVTFLKGMIND